MGTPIVARPRATETQAAAWATRKGAPGWFVELVPTWWRECQKRGVDPAAAFAQSCKETGFGAFGRATTRAHKNPCGLKIRSPKGPDTNPADHVTFDSWAQGIGAQADHLALYAGAPGYPKDWPQETADQRQFATLLGDAATWEELGGRWAPDPNYGRNIVAMVRDMTGAAAQTGAVLGDNALVSKFCQARYYTKGPRTKGPIIWLVMHTAETPESSTAAESLCTYCANNDRRASWHYAVDDNSVTQSVREKDIAWAAAGANAQGVHIELAGKASQSGIVLGAPRPGWGDPFSVAELRLGARLAADICIRNRIPVEFRKAADLTAKKPGITTHYEVDHAFPSTGHVDPGPNFPMKAFIQDVARMVKHPWPGRLLKLQTPHVTGADVIAAQERLGRHGYAVPVDGDFAQADKDAVKAFQTAKGLPVDGVVGWLSWDELWKHPTP